MLVNVLDQLVSFQTENKKKNRPSLLTIAVPPQVPHFLSKGVNVGAMVLVHFPPNVIERFASPVSLPTEKRA